MAIEIVSTHGITAENRGLHAAFLGVSVYSHFFSRENITEIVQWSQQNFSRLLLLIADEPQRYTLMATKHLSLDEATREADEVGKRRFSSITNWLSRFAPLSVTVSRWKDISTNAEFCAILSCLNEAYENQPELREDIRLQIERRNSAVAASRPDRIISAENYGIAAKYVLNELAAMVYLQEHANPSWPVQLFPLPMPPALVGLYADKYKCGVRLNPERSGYIQVSIS
jgi:tRNA-dependent cyclodipeptide synthase